ncbi:autoinducer binding domain-containing protein [Pseudomonas aeruginosa]|uniref:autoinducer binding domain-containing protein n=1 Tax=Pseudomonas aeruginosa TaxID=287 RepID=UPI000EB4FF28|nr:autoinducer binding domain-containing protein [Pseudomonas aeruginosa]
MRNDGGFLLWWDGLRSEMQPIHDSQGVFAVLEKEVRRLGFDYYAYGVRHTIPFTRPKTEVHGTYPKAWLERYQMQNYGAVDPAILNGLRSSEMVVWSDSLFDQSRMLWNEARDWGLCVGATLPIRAPNNLLSVLSVARDQQNISSFEREEIRLRLRCMIELLTQKLTDLEHPMLMSNPVLPAGELQWGVLVWMGLLATALGQFWWNKGATEVDAGTLAVMNNLHVPVGLLLNLLIWNQHADLPRLALGGAVIVASLWVNRLGRREVRA